MFKFLLKLENFIEVWFFDSDSLYILSIILSYIFVSIENGWGDILANLITAIFIAIFVAFALGVVMGFIWLILGVIIEILSEFGENRKIYSKHLNQKISEIKESNLKVENENNKKNNSSNSLILGLLFGWFLFHNEDR